MKDSDGLGSRLVNRRVRDALRNDLWTLNA